MTLIDLFSMVVVLGLGALITLLAVALGAYLMFRGARSVPGEKLFGGVPKGQVFSITDPLEAEPEPSEVEKQMLEKTNSFLKLFSGEGK